MLAFSLIAVCVGTVQSAVLSSIPGLCDRAHPMAWRDSVPVAKWWGTPCTALFATSHIRLDRSLVRSSSRNGSWSKLRILPASRSSCMFPTQCPSHPAPASLSFAQFLAILGDFVSTRQDSTSKEPYQGSARVVTQIRMPKSITM